MSHTVIDFELARKNVTKKLGNFDNRKIQEKSFCPQKQYKPTELAFWSTMKLQEIVQDKGCLDYRELLNILPEDVESNTLQYFWQFDG